MRVLHTLSILVAAFCLLSAGPTRAAEKVGASTCIGCHDNKEAFKDSFHGKKLPVAKNISVEESCETCHGNGSEHAAAGGDRSNAGFSTIKKPTSRDCLSCHKGGEVKLWDVSSHAQNGLDCTSCHSVHKGDGDKNAGKSSKNLKLSKNETCLQCHTTKRLDINKPSHHPLKEGKMACTDCHNPHGGQWGNLRAENTPELCAKCHAEKLGPWVHEHPPVSEDCGICHDPHGSPGPKLLKKRLPMLCIECHIQPHWSGAPVPNRRAFYSCTNCHRELHGSDRQRRFLPH